LLQLQRSPRRRHAERAVSGYSQLLGRFTPTVTVLALQQRFLSGRKLR
jgi:hypothetical protein